MSIYTSSLLVSLLVRFSKKSSTSKQQTDVYRLPLVLINIRLVTPGVMISQAVNERACSVAPRCRSWRVGSRSASDSVDHDLPHI